MSTPETDLWSQFNLGENNRDPGGGILYNLRYSPEQLAVKRETIKAALVSMGISLVDRGDEVGVTAEDVVEDGDVIERAMYLLEELSVINEAQEYAQAGFADIKSIPALVSYLIAAYYQCLLKSGESGLDDAYDIVTVIVPQIVYDLSIADGQNSVLSNRDRIVLKELGDFGSAQQQRLNGANTVPKTFVYNFR